MNTGLFVFFFLPMIRKKKERKAKRKTSQTFSIHLNRNLQSEQLPLCVHISTAGWWGGGSVWGGVFAA